VPVYEAAHKGTSPERAGHRHASIAPYGIYELVAGNEARIVNIDELEREIASVFSIIPATDIMERLAASQVVWARAREPLAVWEHEQHRARDRFLSTAVPTGEVVVFRPPFNISDTPDPIAAVPALNEHDPTLVAGVEQRRPSPLP